MCNVSVVGGGGKVIDEASERDEILPTLMVDVSGFPCARDLFSYCILSGVVFESNQFCYLIQIFDKSLAESTDLDGDFEQTPRLVRSILTENDHNYNKKSRLGYQVGDKRSRNGLP
jgi:hypothetical protein